MSAVEFDVMKDAVTARIEDWDWRSEREEVTLSVRGPTPEMNDRLKQLLGRALVDDYSLEIRLVTYEGAPNAVVARARRKQSPSPRIDTGLFKESD